MKKLTSQQKLLLIIPVVISVAGLLMINQSIKASAYLKPGVIVTNSFLLLILVALSVIIMELESIKKNWKK